VELLGTKQTEKGAEYLLTMEPGSSVRITRTGKLGELPPEFSLTWSGRYDYNEWVRCLWEQYEKDLIEPTMRNVGLLLRPHTRRHG
jgi:hypothetical protein